MQKIKFNNEYFYWFAIVLLSGFCTWNLIVLIQGSLIALLPISIQIIIIILFLTKNKHARIAIKIWAFVFLVVASGLQLIGRTMVDSVDNFIAFDLVYYIKAIISVTIGLILFITAKNTMEIVSVENQ
jgi:uncharacterized membrane protein